MHYLISQQPKQIVGQARVITDKEMAQIALRAAGGGYSDQQTADAMFIASQMRSGDWVHKAAGVRHAIIKAGE